MPKSKSSVSQNIISAAEIVYAILTEHNVKACAIGSLAIAYNTKKSFGRDPNSLDFVTFQRGHNQRFLNELLLASRPELFVIGSQSAANSHLPPMLFYKAQNSSIAKIRVFFLPLWTQHSQENIPPLGHDDVVEPKSPHTVPLAPLPFLIYLQLHGWAWNNTLARENPTNKRANTKRDNFASDLRYLLPLAVKRRAHFDWLPDEFKGRLKNNANEFIQGHSELCSDWAKVGVSGLAVKPMTTQPEKGQPTKAKPKKGVKPGKVEAKPKVDAMPKVEPKPKTKFQSKGKNNPKESGPFQAQEKPKKEKKRTGKTTKAKPKKFQLKPANMPNANPRGVYPIKEMDIRDARRDRAKRRERKLKLRKEPQPMPDAVWTEGKIGGFITSSIKDQLKVMEFNEEHPGGLDFD